MSYLGTVQNGVIVLEPGAQLPEGTTVRVQPELNAADSPAPEPPMTDEELENDPLIRMLKCAGSTGIPDLGVNSDHYLYGHPKVTTGK
jgi:hypothetical protein